MSSVIQGREKVEVVSKGYWSTPNEGEHLKTSIGRSEKGFHCAIEVVRGSWESGGEWSKALPTQKAAEDAAVSHAMREMTVYRNLAKQDRATGEQLDFWNKEIREGQVIRENARQQREAEKSSEPTKSFENTL